jgi:enoyl-CoA hydratase
VTDVVLDIRDGVAVITLDGAANRNALDTDTARSLIEACERIDADRSVGAAIVRGANGTFCSGADRAILRRAGEDPAEDERYSELGLIYTAFHRFGTLGVPTLAAATGAAVGAGVNLLLAADVAVVADDLRLIAGFTRAGIHPGGGNLTLLARRGGRTAAGGLGLFDQEVDGRRAVELGLAWEAVPADAVDERALAMARHVAADPALARRTALTMRTELSTAGMTWEAAIDLERAAQMWSLRRRPVEARPEGSAAGRPEVRP